MISRMDGRGERMLEGWDGRSGGGDWQGCGMREWMMGGWRGSEGDAVFGNGGDVFKVGLKTFEKFDGGSGLTR